jgi:hypothetical protein
MTEALGGWRALRGWPTGPRGLDLPAAQFVDLSGQPQHRVLRVREHSLQAADGVGVELSLLQSLALVWLEPVAFKQLADFLLKISHRDHPLVW